MEFMMRRFIVPILCALTLASAACRQAQPVQQNPPAGAAVTLPPVDGTSVLEHIKVLASDEYEGRAPGTRGEDLTVAYITDQLKKLGIKPGNTDGT
jgi:hypothetical protein